MIEMPSGDDEEMGESRRSRTKSESEVTSTRIHKAQTLIPRQPLRVEGDDKAEVSSRNDAHTTGHRVDVEAKDGRVWMR